MIDAPQYSTDSWTKGSGHVKHFYVEASSLSRGTKLWGYSLAKDKTGAWFKSHKTGHIRFFTLTQTQHDFDNDVTVWVLECKSEGIMLTVFND